MNSKAPSDSDSARSPTSRRRLPRFPLNNLQVILIALLVIGGRLVIDFSRRIVEGQQKITEQHELEAEIEALIKEEQRLEAAKTYYSSPGFVETWAHNDGKMVRQGEVLVVPLYEDVAEEALRTNDASAASTTASWQVWWSLFFDNPAPFAPSLPLTGQ
jgi:cell division protein FtsB